MDEALASASGAGNSAGTFHVFPVAADSYGGRRSQLEKLEQSLEDASREGSEGLTRFAAGRVLSGEYRAALVGRTRAELLAEARRLLADERMVETASAYTPVAFIFPGIGDEYTGMGAGLYAKYPVFRTHVDRCAAVLAPLLNCDVRSKLNEVSSVLSEPREAGSSGVNLRALLKGSQGGSETALGGTAVTHAAVFTVEYALAQLWMSFGVCPQFLLGYSVGEYVAACVSGVFGLEQSLQLLVERARAVEALPSGAMLAVALSEQELQARLGPDVDLAAVSGPAMCVASGPEPAIARLRETLEQEDIACRPLASERAFHSRYMAPAAETVARTVSAASPRIPRIPILSTMKGAWLSNAEALDPDYWRRHLTQPVRFAEAAGVAWRDLPRCVLLEVGPGQTLTGLAMAHPDRDPAGGGFAAASMRYHYDGRSDDEFLLSSAARLWSTGSNVLWPAVLGTGPTEGVAAELAPGGPVGEATCASGEIVSQLSQMWREVLKREELKEIGASERFLDLGGNSLIATRLLLRIRKKFGITVGIGAFMQAETVVAQAALVKSLLSPGDGRDGGELDVPAALARHGASLKVLDNGMRVVQFNPAETEHFYDDIFAHRTYTKHGISLEGASCIFDVGANIGMFSLYAGQTCPDATIYAFEPAPVLLQALEANARAHSLRVVPFACGLGSTESELEFTYYPRSTGMSSFHADRAEEEEVLRAVMGNQLRDRPTERAVLKQHGEELFGERLAAETYTCPVRTLSQVIDEHSVARIDLLKIDVQKSELAVLQGIEGRHWPLIRQVVIEVHDVDDRVSVVRALLSDHGFDVLVEQDPVYAGTVMFNIYARNRAGFRSRSKLRARTP